MGSPPGKGAAVVAVATGTAVTALWPKGWLLGVAEGFGLAGVELNAVWRGCVCLRCWSRLSIRLRAVADSK